MRCLLVLLAAVCLETSLPSSSPQAHDFIDAKDQRIAPYPIPGREQNAFAQLPPVPRNALHGVLDNLKVWPTQFKLEVCFMGGSESLRQFFVETAKAWTDSAHLTLDFGSAPAYRDCGPLPNSHIRVAFEAKGDWSLVGTDSIAPDQRNAASLNIGEAADKDFDVLRKDRLRGVILHELGHALGLEHEHQSPESHCEEELDWPTLYTALAQPPSNWSKQEVDFNLRRLVTSPRFSTTPYDPKSIMHYALPAPWFKNGTKSSCYVPENTTLSELDRTIIEAAYPASDQDQQQFLAASGKQIEVLLERSGIGKAQASAIAELARAIVTESHRGMSNFTIHIENIKNQDAEQENLNQKIEGNKNIGVQGVQNSEIHINQGK